MGGLGSHVAGRVERVGFERDNGFIRERATRSTAAVLPLKATLSIMITPSNWRCMPRTVLNKR